MAGHKRFTLRELSLETAVGGFFFLALLLLGYFTILASRDAWFSETVSREARFRDVSGLRSGDSVAVRGVVVGKVTEIELNSDHVIVRMEFTDPPDLFADASASVRSSSLLGGRYLDIDQGSAESGRLPDDEVMRGESSADFLAAGTDLLDDLRDTVAEVRRVVEDEDLLGKTASIVDNLQQISQELRDGKGTAGRLLTERELYDTMKDAVTSVRQAGDGFNAIIAKAQEGEGTLGKLLTEEQLYRDIEAVAADLRAGKGTLGKLLTEDSVHADLQTVLADLKQFSERLAAGEGSFALLFADDGRLYKALLETAEAARGVAEQAAEGDGTVAKLLRDPQLYEDARRTIEDVRAAVEDFREQAPISTFGSLILGGL